MLDDMVLKVVILCIFEGKNIVNMYINQNLRYHHLQLLLQIPLIRRPQHSLPPRSIILDTLGDCWYFKCSH